MQRGARALLEQRGLLSPPEGHANGVEWSSGQKSPSQTRAKSETALAL
jgi:hypothetical protein